MSEERLRVVVFTQEERFFIPTNILKASKVCDIIEIVDNQSKNSMDNKLKDLVKWFGFFQCIKMGFKTGIKVIKGIIDRYMSYKVFNGICSIKDIAHKLGVEYQVVQNINSKDFVQHIKNLKPDLIISYSAPQVVKPPLLTIPKYGIINVHGAILPQYRGLLPSFWYLYNHEKTGGATVHFMSNNIDDGAIFMQGTVDISDCKTMFQLMSKTKKLGGELIVEAIKKCSHGEIVSTPNNINEGSYFTWPTVEQAKEFRRMGKRLA